MKITLFWSYYKSYLSQIYQLNPQLANSTYKQQLDYILSDYFGWPPATLKRLEEQGHEIQILIVNAKPLQESWARENNYDFNYKNWEYDIPLQQVKKFNPNVIWIGSMFNYFGDYLGELKNHCQRIFAWAACPLPKSLDLSYIDCMLTSHTNYQSHFREQGKAAEILLPSFEENILAASIIEHRDVECSFVGGLSYAHIKRIETIKKLTNESPIQIWSEYPKLFSRGILKPRFWNAYLKLVNVRSRMNPSVWGMDMYEVLARSKITINIHAEVASGLAGNMRMFEATGMGALLLTENAPNISELYVPGKEVITYHSIENLIEIITYYIDHHQERELIAQAGQARTLKDHSTVQRSQELMSIFIRYL